MIDAASNRKITALCQELDTKAGAQIAIVTIHTLEGDSVEDFANQLAEKWAPGRKRNDRGVMILLAVDDHQYWTKSAMAWSPSCPTVKSAASAARCCRCFRQSQYGAALLQITVASRRGDRRRTAASR